LRYYARAGQSARRLEAITAQIAVLKSLRRIKCVKILNIVGARPNLVKIAPLLKAMVSDKKIEPILVHTGQHYDEKLSGVFFEQMGIRRPDINLNVGSGTQAWQTAEILKRIELVLFEQSPDVVLVVGDVNSTMAGSLAAAKLGIPIAHVEAGLRSFDRSMPEEINRVVTDALADYLFVTEESAIENLLNEGHSHEHIHFVGNVMIDALQQFLPLAARSRTLEDLGLVKNGGYLAYGILTLHRPANVDSPETLTKLLGVIETVADKLPIIFPVHPRTRLKLENLRRKQHSQLRIVDPLGYLEFLCLLNRARLVLTDSGGIQEETTALGVPCLTLRENTERPVTVIKGTNHIVGHDRQRILPAVELILKGRDKTGQMPELWDGHAAERIIQILIQNLTAKAQLPSDRTRD
jgi:UDP-N-acetylglucosamine 2-epimerase (non-hydrolysing)